ncbi:hypothetical protein Tco_0177112 [Tanacetum coccineum]
MQQTTTPISTPPISTDAPTITTVVPESDALSVVQLRVAKLEKDVSGLKNIDLSAEALAALKTQVPSVVDKYLGSKVGDVFQRELKKHTADLIQKYYLYWNDPRDFAKPVKAIALPQDVPSTSDCRLIELETQCDTRNLGKLALPLDMAMCSFYVIKWCAI